jgi:uncharacterized membrane protein YphA (DoxX/SURF4 family)
VLVARIAATALALVLVVAAGAKLRQPDRTGADLAQLGLAAPRVLAWLVPAAELVAAGLLVAVPAWGGIFAFALLAAFSAVLIQVLRSAQTVSCNCFGALGRQPVSVWSLARNLVFLVLAGLAACY